MNEEMMTLDEAIAHLEESLQDPDHEWSCEACRNEHLQLLSWLKDYRWLLKIVRGTDCYASCEGVDITIKGGADR